ncbi:hypothetical protein PGT21_008566 [Puccinia graminis f. sp. tritici]|uniref:Uncharacterized protein n=1 Tax=Puccinia graminis f. sp. tritici TaxID=56615 RepID=A0A5B0LKZ9_PUCGR|nr:hypothetical protein PGT21_008566 [Puccinia graminis f. sp. tritici]
MSRWLKATEPSDHNGDMITAFQEAETRLDEIEKRTGKLTKDTGLALVAVLLQRCQAHFQQISKR